jgi:hypothetical protein
VGRCRGRAGDNNRSSPLKGGAPTAKILNFFGVCRSCQHFADDVSSWFASSFVFAMFRNFSEMLKSQQVEARAYESFSHQ